MSVSVLLQCDKDYPPKTNKEQNSKWWHSMALYIKIRHKRVDGWFIITKMLQNSYSTSQTYNVEHISSSQLLGIRGTGLGLLTCLGLGDCGLIYDGFCQNDWEHCTLQNMFSPRRLAQACSYGSDRGPRARVSPLSEAFFRPLLASYMLTPHWPKYLHGSA